MPVDIRVYGADRFEDVAKALKAQGDKQLSRDFYRGLNRAVKPMTAEVKESTDHYLPARYAVELSKSLKVKTRRRAGGRRGAAIFLVGAAKTPGGKSRDLGSLNRGRLRHPLFGDRKHWYDQRVSPNWWTEPLVRQAPKVRRELIEVMDDVARRIARG